jgi:hypothetical protein
VGERGLLIADDPRSASGEPVFVGAGDIAGCDRTGDEATAELLDDIVAAAPSTKTGYHSPKCPV